MSTVAVRAAEEPFSFVAELKRSPGWILVILSAAVLYAQMLGALAVEWWQNPDYSHGLLVPFAVAYLLYEKRNVFASLPVQPSWFGLVVIAGSQVINLVGFLGAEFFLQRFSFIVFVGGLLLYLAGWRYLWESAFALLLFALAIPLPVIVFNLVALPLQLIASSWAESFLRACQIPVFREGNILILPQQTLNVTEACSGIRSLMSLISLGVMLGYFLPFKFWVRALFVVTTIPIALVANAFRVGGTGILAQSFGERAAQGFFHTFSGWLVFVFAFSVLLLEVTVLQKLLGKTVKGEKNEA